MHVVDNVVGIENEDEVLSAEIGHPVGDQSIGYPHCRILRHSKNPTHHHQIQILQAVGVHASRCLAPGARVIAEDVFRLRETGLDQLIDPIGINHLDPISAN